MKIIEIKAASSQNNCPLRDGIETCCSKSSVTTRGPKCTPPSSYTVVVEDGVVHSAGSKVSTRTPMSSGVFVFLEVIDGLASEALDPFFNESISFSSSSFSSITFCRVLETMRYLQTGQWEVLFIYPLTTCRLNLGSKTHVFTCFSHLVQGAGNRCWASHRSLTSQVNKNGTLLTME